MHIWLAPNYVYAKFLGYLTLVALNWFEVIKSYFHVSFRNTETVHAVEIFRKQPGHPISDTTRMRTFQILAF